MPDTHIIKTLEAKPFDSLSSEDIASVKSHIVSCAECKAAYDAAQISTSLIKARAAETVDVGPFFKTRVMSAIRESKFSPEEAPLVRMWRAAGAMVLTMAVLLVMLAGMTILTESPDSSADLTAATSQNLYSAEYVVLERRDLDDDELANDQVVSTIYGVEDSDGQ